MTIIAFDQVYLPITFPFFQLTLTPLALLTRLAAFDINEFCDIVFFRKPVCAFFFMLAYATMQVIRTAYIKRALGLIGHDINIKHFFCLKWAPACAGEAVW